MNELQQTGLNWAGIGQVLTYELLVGTAYALLIYWLTRKGWMVAYTFVLVILGTLFTVLLLLPLIGLTNVIYTLIGFAGSGLPMSIMSMVLNEQTRKADLDSSRRVAKEALKDGK